MKNTLNHTSDKTSNPVIVEVNRSTYTNVFKWVNSKQGAGCDLAESIVLYACLADGSPESDFEALVRQIRTRGSKIVIADSEVK